MKWDKSRCSIRSHMILQMFRLITLFGCIFLGSTQTSVTQGGEGKDPWIGSTAGYVTKSNLELNATKNSISSSPSQSAFYWATTTTNPTYTGLETPPISNSRLYTTSASLVSSDNQYKTGLNYYQNSKRDSLSTVPHFSSSITPQSSQLTTTEFPSDTANQLPQGLKQHILPSSLPNLSTFSPPTLRRRSYQGTHSSVSVVKRINHSLKQLNYSSQTSTTSRFPSTNSPSISSTNTNHSTVKHWKTRNTTPLITSPAKTTPVLPVVDQDEYYSAYPDYSESLVQTNLTGKVDGVLVPEPESVNSRVSWEKKQQAQTNTKHILHDNINPSSDRIRPQDSGSPWDIDSSLGRRNFGVQGSSSVALEQSILSPLDQIRTEQDRKLTLELPDDSLADTDLHDHDLIDSVMYIYFGASPSDQRAPGRQVVVVGCVVGLLAQFLTLAGGIKRMRAKPDSSLSVLLNTELALTLTNLVFILGVQARGNHCEAVAVSLHYLHLVVCSWLSASCLHSYRRIVHPNRSNPLVLYAAVSWGLPAIPTLLCYWLEREAYETRDYCWMSVERGMMLSFLLPTSLLILVNTVLALAGLRQAKQDDPERRSLRISASLLPMFSVIWFLGVVALEHSSSLVLPLLFVATSGFLNWFVLICWLPSEAGGWRVTDEDLEDDEDDLYEQDIKVVMDEQPLLQEVCLSRPPYHTLHMEPISTISS